MRVYKPNMGWVSHSGTIFIAAILFVFGTAIFGLALSLLLAHIFSNFLVFFIGFGSCGVFFFFISVYLIHSRRLNIKEYKIDNKSIHIIKNITKSEKIPLNKIKEIGYCQRLSKRNLKPFRTVQYVELHLKNKKSVKMYFAHFKKKEFERFLKDLKQVLPDVWIYSLG